MIYIRITITAEQNKHPNSGPNPAERAAMTTPAVLGPVTAAEAVHSYGHVEAPFIENIPASDHLSSMLGSFTLGVVGGALTERAAGYMESRGRLGAAERIRHYGNAITAMGSIACQMAIETSTRGTGDKWDIVAGALATAPGILAGRGYAKMFRRKR